MPALNELDTGRAPNLPSERALTDRYRLVSRLGSGATGTVYAAEHVLIGRNVAVKRFHPHLAEKDDQCQRFRREAQAAARVRSANVVSILDFGFDSYGIPFLVMDRPPGVDLKRILSRDGRLAPIRAVNLALGACTGLSAVHAAGVLHRDLKPSNLLVSTDGRQRELCQILDFGVAKIVGEDLRSLTQTGDIVGTISYMSPEQARGNAGLDGRSDIYSLGAVLYECLVGRPPHRGDTPHALLQAVVSELPVRLEAMRPELPPELCRIVHTALSKDRSERFASAEAFADALAAFSGIHCVTPNNPGIRDVEGPHETTLTAVPPALPLMRRRMSVFSALVVPVLCAAGGLAIGRHALAPNVPERMTRDLGSRFLELTDDVGALALRVKQSGSLTPLHALVCATPTPEQRFRTAPPGGSENPPAARQDTFSGGQPTSTLRGHIDPTNPYDR